MRLARALCSLYPARLRRTHGAERVSLVEARLARGRATGVRRVLGVVATPLWDVGRTWAAELAPAGHTGSGAGMVLGIGFCLSAMGPILAGGLRDLTGSFQTATMIVPITAVILIILSTTLPDDPRRVPAVEPAQAMPGG